MLAPPCLILRIPARLRRAISHVRKLTLAEHIRRHGIQPPPLLFGDFPELLRRCPCLREFWIVDEAPMSMMAVSRTISDLVTEFAPDELQGADMYMEAVPVQPPSASADPYRAQQNYLDPAPLGIDLEAVAGRLAVRNVTLAVVEQGWNLEHEELRDERFRLVWGINYRFHGHGTAVLGMLTANQRNGIGGVGIVPDTVKIVLSSEFTIKQNGEVRYSTALAIAGAIRNGRLKRGDILLIESQVRTEDGLLLPAEADPAVRAVIECAINHYGIIVIEAAGNGGILLDTYARCNPMTCVVERPFSPARESSGAIIVGAGSADRAHAPLFFTNRGTHVRCYGWGEDVTTCGDGATGCEDDEYRSDFSGTSAAAATVAGVAAVIQSIARPGRVDPDVLRDALTDSTFGTTTLQSAGIGVMPDLEKLADEFAPCCNTIGLPLTTLQQPQECEDDQEGDEGWPLELYDEDGDDEPPPDNGDDGDGNEEPDVPGGGGGLPPPPPPAI